MRWRDRLRLVFPWICSSLHFGVLSSLGSPLLFLLSSSCVSPALPSGVLFRLVCSRLWSPLGSGLPLDPALCSLSSAFCSDSFLCSDLNLALVHSVLLAREVLVLKNPRAFFTVKPMPNRWASFPGGAILLEEAAKFNMSLRLMRGKKRSITSKTIFDILS